MSLEPFAIDEYGGLDLQRDPAEIGLSAAIDALNVEFRPGIVETRDGYTNWTSEGGSGRFWRAAPFYQTSGARQLMAGADNSFVALSNAAGIVEEVTQGGTPYFATYGTPIQEAVYFGSTSDVIGRYTAASSTTGSSSLGTTMASVDGVGSLKMPKGGPMCVSPIDNRLVVNARNAGPNDLPSSRSRVWFSDAGNPESWQSNNYVELTPGDGEEITAIVAWQSYVIVFKQTKYFVFYGTSSDVDGNPVFNYRPVDTGVGIGLQPGRGIPAIATDRGVFFLDVTGIYLTTSGEPTRVSTAMDPFFHGGASSFYQGGLFNQGANSNASLCYHDNRLFLTCRSTLDTDNHQDRVLVHHLIEGWWSLWDVRANALVPFRTSGDGWEDLYFTFSDRHEIGKFGGTTDSGANVTTRYRSGFGDLDQPAREKTIRETLVVGKGTPTLSWSRDFGSLGSGQSVSLGSSLSRKLDRQAIAGELLSFQLSASSNSAWQVNRLEPMLREVREAGAMTS